MFVMIKYLYSCLYIYVNFVHTNNNYYFKKLFLMCTILKSLLNLL